MSRPNLVVVASALVLVSVGFLGCETSKSAEQEEPDTDALRHLEQRTGIELERLFGEAERLRDREYDERPSVEIVRELPRSNADRPAGSIQPAVFTPLFGLDEVQLELRSPLVDIARYDRDDHRILVRRGYPSEATLRIALLAAIVRGLDARHFEPIPRAKGFDGRLGRFAASRADVMLVLAAYLYERRVDDGSSGLDAIASRPEISLELEPLAGYLDRRDAQKKSPIDSAKTLQSRLVSFGLREGLSLAAALYRSAGWSGVELLYEMPPESTADVVRPDRWMAGEGLGDWTWPTPPGAGDTYDPNRVGRIGPAAISIWIAQAFRPELARTIYSGWRSDSFRFERLESDERGAGQLAGWQFEWLQQWDTPTSARQIAEASRTILHLSHGKPEAGSTRWRVVRRGLRVGIVLREENSADGGKPLDRATYLLEAKPAFHPRDRLPLAFQPTRSEQFRRDVRKADVEKATWRDPASKLEADVSMLENWTFRLSRTLPLRWFAKKSDGAIVQFTTELKSPLAPPFNSSAHRRRLRDSFERPLAEATFHGPETTNTPVSPTLVFSVSGTKSDSEWKMKVWQFERGDVVATLSLQAPKSAYSKYLETAESVHESIRTIGPAPGSDEQSSKKGTGSIEYEIEQ